MFFELKTIETGIVELNIDFQHSKVNIINQEFIESFSRAIDAVASYPALKGVVVTSGKRDFLLGADLNLIHSLGSPEAIFKVADAFKSELLRLEKLGKPVVCAIHGSALGGGLELALACHYRICLADQGIKLGFPEVKLGLIPGGGGTQRLPRMLGFQKAIPVLLEGRELRPQEALKLGIVDDTAETQEALLKKALTWILEHPEPSKPWFEKGFRWPGGDTMTPANAQLWSVAPAMMYKKNRGVFPASTYILSAVFEGSLVDFDTACRIESRYFVQAVLSQTSKNMREVLWYQLNQIKKGESRPAQVPRSLLKKVGIIGAGMMGAGIAFVCAKHGIEVVLKDTTLEKAEKGKHVARKILQKKVNTGVMDQPVCDLVLSRIHCTDSLELFRDCDLVVEAVFENRDLKKRVIAETEAVLPKHAAFGSNTSTLPITSLAETSMDPSKFVGIHFFSPVHKMQLVELIKGKQTSPETLARAFDFTQQIKKIPIVVNDSRGFYTTRVFISYVLEGVALLGEGVHPEQIEQAAISAGMAMGPLAVADEVSLSLMDHILTQNKQDLLAEGKTWVSHPAEPVVEKMVNKFKRTGKAVKAGFYEYPETGLKHVWPGLLEHFSLQSNSLDQETLQMRLLYIQSLESLRCLQEGVITSIADANIGSLFGWGFAPNLGGTIQLIKALGVNEFKTRCRQLEEFGSRFKAEENLWKML